MTLKPKTTAPYSTSSITGVLQRAGRRLLAISLLFAAPAAMAKSTAAEMAEKEKEKAAEDGRANVDDGGASTGAQADVQSAARPFRLDIAAPVMQGGSDERSAAFLEILPQMTEFLRMSLGESSRADDSRMLLDPGNLRLSTDSDVRIYFIGEGAGYSNTLGFDTTGEGIKAEDAALIFPNASSPVSTYNPSNSVNRTGWAPLLPGDFVNLGRIAGGSILDFFLIADGANGGRNVFSTDRSANGDGINHVVAFSYHMANSPFLIIGFEDLWGGGDRDFNDLLFAVDIGMANVRALTSTPEPASAITLASFMGLVLIRRKRARV